MAELNSLEWMTEQRDRLKVECDAVNTRYDQLVAADKTAQAEMQATIALLEAQCATSKSLAIQRRLALADVLNLVSALMAKVLPLVTE